MGRPLEPYTLDLDIPRAYAPVIPHAPQRPRQVALLAETRLCVHAKGRPSGRTPQEPS